MSRNAPAEAPFTPAATPSPAAGSDAAGESWNISRALRERRNGHRAAVVWLTGLSGSGKSTLAREVERRLFALGCQTALLDGDELRQGLCAGLGFTADDRRENIRRASHAARLFLEHGHLVLCAFVSPFRRDRELARQLIGPECFLEVFVDCSFEECRRRDPKGLYAAATAGAVANFTGLSQPYEPPLTPDFVARTELHSSSDLAGDVVALLQAHACLPRADKRAA